MKRTVITVLVILYLHSVYGSLYIMNSCRMNAAISQNGANMQCTCSTHLHQQTEKTESACCSSEIPPPEHEQEGLDLHNDCCTLVVEINQVDDAVIIPTIFQDQFITLSDYQLFSPSENLQKTYPGTFTGPQTVISLLAPPLLI